MAEEHKGREAPVQGSLGRAGRARPAGSGNRGVTPEQGLREAGGAVQSKCCGGSGQQRGLRRGRAPLNPRTAGG